MFNKRIPSSESRPCRIKYNKRRQQCQCQCIVVVVLSFVRAFLEMAVHGAAQRSASQSSLKRERYSAIIFRRRKPRAIIIMQSTKKKRQDTRKDKV